MILIIFLAVSGDVIGDSRITHAPLAFHLHSTWLALFRRWTSLWALLLIHASLFFMKLKIRQHMFYPLLKRVLVLNPPIRSHHLADALLKWVPGNSKKKIITFSMKKASNTISKWVDGLAHSSMMSFLFFMITQTLSHQIPVQTQSVYHKVVLLVRTVTGHLIVTLYFIRFFCVLQYICFTTPPI